MALDGGAIVYSPRGEFHCACVDVSAGGMAIVATTAAKIKERVRVHAQLAGFPLLTDALVVRARHVQTGYLWGLRFLRLDATTRSNLESFVRQQLASAARLRQAQLYATRLRGLGLSPSDSAPLTYDSAPLTHDSAPLTHDSAPLTHDSAPRTHDSAAFAATIEQGQPPPAHRPAPAAAPPTAAPTHAHAGPFEPVPQSAAQAASAEDIPYEERNTPPVAFPAADPGRAEPAPFVDAATEPVAAPDALPERHAQQWFEAGEDAAPQVGNAPPLADHAQPWFEAGPVAPADSGDAPVFDPGAAHATEADALLAMPGDESPASGVSPSVDAPERVTPHDLPANGLGSTTVEPKVWEIDEAEFAALAADMDEPVHPTPALPEEMMVPSSEPPDVERIDVLPSMAPTLPPEALEAHRPPTLPPALEIVDFDEQQADEQPADEQPADEPPADEQPADERAVLPEIEDDPFPGVSEPGLYAAVPSPQLDPDEAPTPPMGTFPLRAEPELYAEAAAHPTPASPFDRLATLGRDDDVDSPYLGDIQGATSDLTPTDTKMRLTDEVLDDPDASPIPKPVDAGPTKPVTVWPAAAAQADESDMADAPDTSDRPTDVPIHGPDVAARTEPSYQAPTGYEVLPDFAYETDIGSPGTMPEPEPARTGETVITDLRTFQMQPPAAVETEEAEPAPQPWPRMPDLGAIPTLDTEPTAVSGFTMVVTLETLEARAGMAVLTQAPDFDTDMRPNPIVAGAPSAFEPLPDYPEAEDTATVVRDRPPRPLDRPLSPDEGLRLEMVGSAVAASAESPAAVPMLNRRPPEQDDPRKGHTYVEIAGRPAPPPVPSGPAMRGSGSMRRPIRGRRPRTETPSSAFPVVPALSHASEHAAPAPSQVPTGPHPTVDVPPSQTPTGPHAPVGTPPPSQVPTAPHPAATRPGPIDRKSEKRALIEGALAQLKQRTAQKRQERGEPIEPKPAPRPVGRRKRRGQPQQVAVDPRLKDLFRAAIKDLERAREE